MSTISAILEPKDPADRKDYDINWATLLAAEGETTIATSTWSASEPAGLVVESLAPYAPYISGTRAIVWVSGGTAGTRYEAYVSALTAWIGLQILNENAVERIRAAAVRTFTGALELPRRDERRRKLERASHRRKPGRDDGERESSSGPTMRGRPPSGRAGMGGA